jgi:hypothetical protein
MDDMRKLSVIILCLLAALVATPTFALEKNVASQKWTIFCFDDTDNSAKTGDAANITANVYIDGASDAVDDTNPTELSLGYYQFDMAQAETNGEQLTLVPDSSTANIQCIGCPMALWTRPPDHSGLTIANGAVDANITYVQEDAVPDGGDGLLDVNVMEVNGTDQTANDNGADINAILTDTDAYDTDAEYAAAIWDAARSSHTTGDTFGGDALDNDVWTNTIAGYLDTAISGRAPAGEYDTQMGYIPSNLADVPTASELDSEHGDGRWTTY